MIRHTPQVHPSPLLTLVGLSQVPQGLSHSKDSVLSQLCQCPGHTPWKGASKQWADLWCLTFRDFPCSHMNNIRFISCWGSICLFTRCSRTCPRHSLSILRPQYSPNIPWVYQRVTCMFQGVHQNMGPLVQMIEG